MPGKVLLLSGRNMAYKLIRSQKFDLELEEKFDLLKAGRNGAIIG